LRLLFDIRKDAAVAVDLKFVVSMAAENPGMENQGLMMD